MQPLSSIEMQNIVTQQPQRKIKSTAQTHIDFVIAEYHPFCLLYKLEDDELHICTRQEIEEKLKHYYWDGKNILENSWKKNEEANVDIYNYLEYCKKDDNLKKLYENIDNDCFTRESEIAKDNIAGKLDVINSVSAKVSENSTKKIIELNSKFVDRKEIKKYVKDLHSNVIKFLEPFNDLSSVFRKYPELNKIASLDKESNQLNLLSKQEIEKNLLLENRAWFSTVKNFFVQKTEDSVKKEVIRLIEQILLRILNFDEISSYSIKKTKERNEKKINNFMKSSRSILVVDLFRRVIEQYNIIDGHEFCLDTAQDIKFKISPLSEENINTIQPTRLNPLKFEIGDLSLYNYKKAICYEQKEIYCENTKQIACYIAISGVIVGCCIFTGFSWHDSLQLCVDKEPHFIMYKCVPHCLDLTTSNTSVSCAQASLVAVNSLLSICSIASCELLRLHFRDNVCR